MKTKKKTELLPKGVYVQHSKGKTYIYAWRGKGAPSIKAEPGTDAFLIELAAKRTGGGADAAKNVRALITRYKSSAQWTDDIGDETRKAYGVWLDRISDKWGKVKVTDFDRPLAVIDVKKWRDKYRETPNAADAGLAVLKRLLNWAREEEGLLTNNPCSNIKDIGGTDRSEIIWEPHHMKLLAAELREDMMRVVVLASLTGLRVSDIIRLAWSHVHETHIEIGSYKSRETVKGKRGEAQRTYLIPMYPALAEFLAATPRRSTIVMTNRFGQPWTKASSFSAMFSTAKNEIAGLGHLHFHDLRGTAATMFRRAGFSAEEIAEVLAWDPDTVRRIIKRYVERDVLIRARIERLATAAKNAG